MILLPGCKCCGGEWACYEALGNCPPAESLVMVQKFKVNSVIYSGLAYESPDVPDKDYETQIQNWLDDLEFRYSPSASTPTTWKIYGGGGWETCGGCNPIAGAENLDGYLTAGVNDCSLNLGATVGSASFPCVDSGAGGEIWLNPGDRLALTTSPQCSANLGLPDKYVVQFAFVPNTDPIRTGLIKLTDGVGFSAVSTTPGPPINGPPGSAPASPHAIVYVYDASLPASPGSTNYRVYALNVESTYTVAVSHDSPTAATRSCFKIGAQPSNYWRVDPTTEYENEAGCKDGPCGGPFKCYTDGTDYQCVGVDETPPNGWTTDGVEHTARADCEAACGGGPTGDPCDCPENKASAAKVEYFDAVFDSITPGSSATPEQITEGLAIANATQYTLTAGTGFVWVPDITMPDVPSVGVDCETRPGQDVGSGNLVLIDGTGGLNAECTGKLFGAVATLKSYYTKAEWDNFCLGDGFPPSSPDRLVLTFDPFDASGGGAALTDSWHSCGSQDQVFEHLTVYGVIQQNHPEKYGFVFNCKVRVTFSGNPLP